MSIDYGTKRVGLAVTDSLKIIATALGTVHAKDAMEYIGEYLKKEQVELFVVGLPKNLDNTDAESMAYVKPFVKKLEEKYAIPVVWVDERYTSKLAMQSMVFSGVKKSERRKKENTDKVSAVIILQSYLESISFK